MKLLLRILNIAQYIAGGLTCIYFVITYNFMGLPGGNDMTFRFDTVHKNLLLLLLLVLVLIIFTKAYLDFKNHTNASLFVGIMLFLLPFVYEILRSYLYKHYSFY
ncbi:MAG: hypothetical protein ACRCVT_14900 [Leadbetterella sp.]